MPSNEPTEERIIAAIASTLEAITPGVDSEYWYTPRVIRADQYEDKRLFRTEIGGPIYIVRDTSELVQAPPLRQFGKDARVLTVFVLCAYYDSRADRDPYSMESPTPGTIRHRMIRDVTKALNANPKLSGTAIDLDVSDPTKDFEAGMETWILAEIPIVVLYEHPYDEP